MPRLVRVAGPALLLAVALLSLLAALQFGGGAAALPLSDPGALVRYGLPISTLIVDLSAAGTIGALVLVCFALSPDKPEFEKSLDVAAGASALWAVSSAVTAFFTFLSLYQEPVASGRFGQLLGDFLTNFAPGRAWLATTLVAAVVTVLCFAVRNRTALVFLTAFSGVGLIPIALQGHAAEAAGHDIAVTSLGLHLVFVAVWLGGLLTIVLIRGSLVAGRIGPVIGRYSTLAIVCFLVVAASGLVNATLRVGSVAALLTPYGILVLVKVVALGALGFFGLVQRRFLIARMQQPGNARKGYFWWLVVAELGFMGLASGVATALARTAPPVPQVRIATTPASLLTGERLPPELTLSRYFTEWRFDLLWVLVIAFLAFFYLAGVWRLRRRGDRWPLHRTILWLAGLALLFYSTNGGVNVYEKYLFSVHMFMHMMLTMMVPLLLVPGAPVTLALRAIRKRRDHSRGTREWILIAVHSKVAGVLTNPVVAAVIFAGSLWLFYYSPLFRWATTDHIGHEFMVVHFLLAGYLFVTALIGVDPVPKPAPYPLRLIVLLGTLAFHAFFGLTLMTGSGLLLADWFGAMGRTWGASAIVDQQVGGGIAWSVGEIPTAILALTVAYLWFRNDVKDAKRLDRQSDRTGNADLSDYNAMLARLDKVPDERPHSH